MGRLARSSAFTAGTDFFSLGTARNVIISEWVDALSDLRDDGTSS
jgi:hypothetical protein